MRAGSGDLSDGVKRELFNVIGSGLEEEDEWRERREEARCWTRRGGWRWRGR